MRHILLTGGTVVSNDPDIGIVDKGDVLIVRDRVAAVGVGLSAPEGALVVDVEGKIVMPGFVNAHMHTWQTGLRGIASDWTIGEYLHAMHAGLAGRFYPEDVYFANLAGALHQIDSGTTTLVDWCHNNPRPDYTDAAIDGLERSGIRAVFMHGSPKPDPKPGQKHFSEVPMPRGEVERLRNGRLSSDSRLVTMGLAILGPGFSTYAVTRADFALAREFGLMASMHVTGKMLVPDGFERLAAEDALAAAWPNLVHGNLLSDETLALLVDHGASFTVTPEIEMQMGFGKPLTNRLVARGTAVSLGSDIESAASSDMFSVARFALQSARMIDCLEAMERTGKARDTVAFTAVDAFRWATIDGARMARLDHKTGSLTPGKAADVVVLRTDRLAPVHDPYAAIVLHAGPRDVDTVLIAGEFRKRDGQLLATNRDSVLAAVERSGRRIAARQRRAPGRR
jgi:cytosine/adenosine deaminase-related metal-dependent hydrolase